MSDSDALLWTIGRDPVLRTTIVAVLVLDRSPRFGEVRARMEGLTQAEPRLRSRVEPAPLGWGRPAFVDDPGFDVDLHLRRMVAPPPATLRTVLDLAQVMGTVSFDPALPLWEAVVVEGLDAGQAAMVIKLHHAVVDGVGGIGVAMRLLDRHRGARPSDRPETPAGPGGPAPPAGPASPSASAAGVLRAGWAQAASASRQLLGLAARTAARPVEQAARARAGARSVARLLAPARRPMSALLSERGIARRFEVLDLDPRRLHEAGAATHSTMNDVFVTGVLGGLRRYHEAHGRPVEALRVLMPVSVRTGGHEATGNHFVPARFVLPACADPAERLGRVREITASWKNAPGLAVSDVLAAGLDRLPPPLVSRVWGSLLKGDDFVATNVPGPRFETYLAGARIEHFYAFAPPSGAALNVALVTPAGRACVGVNLDAAAVRDPSVMTRCLQDGFDEVLGLAGRVTRASA
ncbi:MAG TPA: wax ester/triacylglycerol synthase domain-containing protein [Acidimicrobiales bacterium]|nr:wax ester/triacylglycerol synthase domain-containing protein [Acidimicrobiales bacterium]